MKNKDAFTLIELLVVIAVIGFLAAIVMVSLNSAREKAGVADIVEKSRAIYNAVALYYDDTGQYPPTCDSSCTAATDPFINSLGVPGWRGPYSTSVYNLTHKWGGQFGWENADSNLDGTVDHIIRINDDSPMGGSNDGLVPYSAMLQIDRILDDGNLDTGRVIGNGAGFGDSAHYGAAPGEMVRIVIY